MTPILHARSRSRFCLAVLNRGSARRTSPRHALILNANWTSLASWLRSKCFRNYCTGSDRMCCWRWREAADWFARSGISGTDDASYRPFSRGEILRRNLLFVNPKRSRHARDRPEPLAHQKPSSARLSRDANLGATAFGGLSRFSRHAADHAVFAASE